MGSPIAPKTKGPSNDEWETPQYVFDALNSEFYFTVDAFATRDNAKLPVYFTKERSVYDEAEFIFRQVIYMNPPYSGLERAVHWGLAQKRHTVVMLLPVKSDNDWWPTLMSAWRRGDVELRFYRKRLAFAYKDIPMTGCPFTSMVVVKRGRVS